MTHQLSEVGKSLIKQSEGCAKAIGGGKFAAYPDPGTGNDPWTIGWGSTGEGIRKGVIWTQAQCDARFDHDIAAFAAKVDALIGDDATTQGQFDAMVSFAYNLGIGNLRSSTLLRKHKAGDFSGARTEFIRWNKAGGHVMEGLTLRRVAEARMYGGLA